MILHIDTEITGYLRTGISAGNKIGTTPIVSQRTVFLHEHLFPGLGIDTQRFHYPDRTHRLAFFVTDRYRGSRRRVVLFIRAIVQCFQWIRYFLEDIFIGSRRRIKIHITPAWRISPNPAVQVHFPTFVFHFTQIGHVRRESHRRRSRHRSDRPFGRRNIIIETHIHRSLQKTQIRTDIIVVFLLPGQIRISQSHQIRPQFALISTLVIIQGCNSIIRIKTLRPGITCRGPEFYPLDPFYITEETLFMQIPTQTEGIKMSPTVIGPEIGRTVQPVIDIQQITIVERIV